MATRIKPLTMSAAALASAAAVAVASPALAPTFGAPTTNTLSRAAYELTTFSDVLSVPAFAWTDTLFGNVPYGGVLGPYNYPTDQNTGLTFRGGYGPAWAQPLDSTFQGYYVNPWAGGCAYQCTSIGISGVAYLFLDALVNGNGSGYYNRDGVLTDPSKPYQPDQSQPNYNPYVTQPWGIGPVNYLFEPYTAGFLGAGSSPLWQQVSEGYSATAWYALRGTLGQALPALQGPIDAFFWGTYNLTFLYEQALRVTAGVLSLVPFVGQFAANSITAYLGELEVAPGSGTYYQYGLSGTLNYWVDVLTGSYEPPAPAATTKAAPGAAVVARAAAATRSAAQTAVTAVTTAATTVAADAAQTKSTAAATASTAPEPTAAAAPSVTPAASSPAADASASVAVDSTPAPVKTTRQHPVRDAVAGAAKAVGSAVSGAAKAATGGAAAASKRAAANGS